MEEREYVSDRLSTNKDDRCSDEKKDMDAKLRGSIGSLKADKIIKMIDEHKSRR